MAIINFLISLAGAVMLLLFGVRMVRTGIERCYGASFKRFMTGQTSLLRASILGVGLAILMQSSAAVALLTAGFAASGVLAFPIAVAIAMGGDLGSALLIRVLSFNLGWLVPILLAVGGYLFVKTEERRWRQAGRIIMGLAFILISLQFLREAMEPIRSSDFLPAISGYLAEDFVTAFLVGGVLAFVMHSSVAAILMCVALVQIGVLPFLAGLSIILGANLGSAVIPLWLSRGMPPLARRIPAANVALRGSCAVLVLWPAQLMLADSLATEGDAAQLLIMLHILFNAALVVVSLPLAKPLEQVFAGMIPLASAQSEPRSLSMRVPSTLSTKENVSPAQALADLKKELLRMSELIAVMFQPVLDLYQSPDKVSIGEIRRLEREVNASLTLIREFVASIPLASFGRQNLKSARSYMDYAIRLNAAADVVALRICKMANDVRNEKLAFSKEGWSELTDMHQAILANLRLASNILISDDLESARLLKLQKTEIKRIEYRSRKRHLKRLQNGNLSSFESSDVHLETLRVLREFNSHIAAVAYPVLYKHGQLLETRLIKDMGALNVD